jgi:pimeloyl-ACP methyl ester carboxylesterase
VGFCAITIKRRRDRTPKVRSRNSDSAILWAAIERSRIAEAALLAVAPTLRSGKLARPVKYMFFRRSNFLAIRVSSLRSSRNNKPGLVREIILAGTGPAGGDGILNAGAVLQDAFGKAGATNKHPKHFLFFTQTSNGQTAADDFLQRLKERTKDLDAGEGDASTLGTVQHPVLVVNGDHDVMVPPFNSFHLARRLPKAQLSILPDAGHGSIFQHHGVFVQQALAFLQQ